MTLDDELVRYMEGDVRAGRAPSVSAWVANAVRAKAQARAELMAELDELERKDPTPPDVIAKIARSVGLPKSKVAAAIKRSRIRRAG